MYMYVCMCMEICPNKKLGFGFIQIFRGSIYRYPQDSFEKIYFFLPPKLFLSRLKIFW